MTRKPNKKPPFQKKGGKEPEQTPKNGKKPPFKKS
jgi:hypothetical protein